MFSKTASGLSSKYKSDSEKLRATFIGKCVSLLESKTTKKQSLDLGIATLKEEEVVVSEEIKQINKLIVETK